jgi:hypothetical protein
MAATKKSGPTRVTEQGQQTTDLDIATDAKSNAAEVQSQSPTPVRPPTPVGYKGHQPGSCKERVHQIFDAEPDKSKLQSRLIALSLGLQTGTVSKWFREWSVSDAGGGDA